MKGELQKCMFTITAEAAWKPKTCFFGSED